MMLQGWCKAGLRIVQRYCKGDVACVAVSVKLLDRASAGISLVSG